MIRAVMSIHEIRRSRLNSIRWFLFHVSGIAAAALKGREDVHRNVDIL